MMLLRCRQRQLTRMSSGEVLRYHALPDTIKPKRQQRATSCAAACLTYAYQILGVERKEGQIHREMDIGNEGACWSDMIAHAKEIGFSVAFFRHRSYEELLAAQLFARGSPILIMWHSPRIPDTDYHMSVLKEINEAEVVLMDPAFGDYYVMSKDEFETVWYDDEGEQSFLIILA